MVHRAKAKIDQMTHPKGFEKMVKQFADRMTKPENKKRNPSAIADVAREFDVSARTFIQYTNKLVQKGVLPKELKAEYQTEDNQMPTDFKSLVLQMEKLRRVKQDPDVKDEPALNQQSIMLELKSLLKMTERTTLKEGQRWMMIIQPHIHQRQVTRVVKQNHLNTLKSSNKCLVSKRKIAHQQKTLR